ncbi:LamG-like jellyroll fold domain-containing protein [Flavobacterium soli]|uniref:LamG-like jellyroll fold domain-containing protein n=1 Tax=Flavobacterium soli TaxID=344881 RepID=UPI0003F858D7|nr:LamG-like jellyroll fold domain-containing protein [Flavobacterium soli]
MRNDNGFIGVDNEYKPILNRHIAVSGEWKEQQFKFVGKNGYWRMIYTEDPIYYDEEFYISHLQGYTLERENQLDIYGDKLTQSLYPFPRVGGYWELSRNFSDIFENFINGSGVGGLIGGAFDNLVGFRPTNSGDYFQLPENINSGLNALGLIGASGTNNFVLSTWFFPNVGYTNQKLPLFSYGNTNTGLEIYIEGTTLHYTTFNNNVANMQTLTIPNLTIGKWHKLVIVRTLGNLNKIYLSTDSNSTPLLNGASITITTPSVAAPLPIRIGADIDLVSNNLFAYRNVYGLGNASISNTNINRLLYREQPVVVLKEKTTATESIVPQEWISLFTDKKISITIPPDFQYGQYDLFIRNSEGKESFKFPVLIKAIELKEEPFFDDFSDPMTLSKNYYLLNRAWGGANGGVVPENISVANGELIIKANGDNYTGNIVGVDKDGNKKFHTHANDPKLGLPWKNRVGGCLVFNKKTGFGSYELDVKIPNVLGVCSAMWTFFYNEIYPTDPRYNHFLNSDYSEIYHNVARFSFNNQTLPLQYNSSNGNASISINEPSSTSRVNGVGDLNINSVNDGAMRYSGSSLNPFTLNNLAYQISSDSPFTIGFWLKVESEAYTPGRVNGLVRLGSGVNSVGVDLVYVGSNATPSLRFAWRTSTNTMLTTDANFGLNLGNWEYVTMTYDGVNDIKCYLNGVLKQTLSKPTGVFTPQNTWQIFNRNTITGTANVTNRTMSIDELIISDTQFTAGQINSLISEPGTFVTFNDNGEGMHQQGTLEDGFYTTRNHEIDIEIPSHLDGGVLAQPSLENIKCNTWRGETQNWDVNIGDGKYWEEYRDNLTPAGVNFGDGAYHKLRFDWYPDKVEFYVDDVLVQTNTNTQAGKTIPDIPGAFTFGMWFPSAPKPEEPWLVNKTKAWAGGIVDTQTDSMIADFDTVEMRVKSFKFNPFIEELANQRILAETYPFGGYRINKNY